MTNEAHNSWAWVAFCDWRTRVMQEKSINHDPKTLAKSEAIRVVNLLIEEALTELRMQMNWATNEMERAIQHGGDVNVRVSYEGGRRDEPLPMHPKNAERIAESLLKSASLYEQINELSRFKLRLFNDYDFTHGDTRTQYAVFGDPNIPQTAATINPND